MNGWMKKNNKEDEDEGTVIDGQTIFSLSPLSIYSVPSVSQSSPNN
jgi:hypothetical protein